MPATPQPPEAMSDHERLKAEGRLIEAGWKRYEQDVLNDPPVDPLNRENCRQAFLSGAMHLFNDLFEAPPDQQAFERAIENLRIEIRAIQQKQILDVTMTQGQQSAENALTRCDDEMAGLEATLAGCDGGGQRVNRSASSPVKSVKLIQPLLSSEEVQALEAILEDAIVKSKEEDDGDPIFHEVNANGVNPFADRRTQVAYTTASPRRG